MTRRGQSLRMAGADRREVAATRIFSALDARSVILHKYGYDSHQPQSNVCCLLFIVPSVSFWRTSFTVKRPPPFVFSGQVPAVDHQGA